MDVINKFSYGKIFLFMIFILFIFLLISLINPNNLKVSSNVVLDSDNLVHKEDLTYLGAFKFPIDRGESVWGFSHSGGRSLTYFPGGDLNGSDDGFPGSLYSLGHIYEDKVAEINIPVPVVSRNASDLNRAEYLQNFYDITGGLRKHPDANKTDEVYGLAYLPKQGTQLSDKIYWAVSVFYHVFTYYHPSFGASELDLSDPKAEGLWFVGDSRKVKKTNRGYIFDVPASFADQYLGGKYLIAGSGPRSGQAGASWGPSMYAFAPWQEEDLSHNSTLDAAELIVYQEGEYPGFTRCDIWSGGAWITRGDKQAVIIAGRKGLGEDYYGNSRPGDCELSRGSHCTPYGPQFLFYNPDDIAAVAKGEKLPGEVLPYEIVNLEDIFWDSCAYKVGGIAFDRDKGFLYVIQTAAEKRTYSPNPIMHVFQVSGTQTCVDNDGDRYGQGCVLGDDCDDNNVSVNVLKSCRYDGESCGDYDLCVASCLDDGGVCSKTDAGESSSGGGGSTGGGGSSGGGSSGSSAKKPQADEESTKTEEQEGLRRVILGPGEDVSFVNVETGETFLIGNEAAFFDVFSEGVVLRALSGDYNIAAGEVLSVVLDGQNVYLGITELKEEGGGSAILALGLSEESVEGEVLRGAEDEVVVSRTDYVTTGLVVSIVIVILVLNSYLLWRRRRGGVKEFW